MKILSQLCGELRQLPLVITHIKPPTDREEIRRELDELNKLGFKIMFAEQAKLLEF
jgi:hypothetical protein